MARKWTNSKGIGVDYDRRIELSLNKLRRELMTPEAYEREYGRNRNRRKRRGRR